jgi:hypothetical protein
MQAMVEAVPITEAAAIGAGAKPLAFVAAGHHRPGDQADRRQVRRYRAHQLRRHGLVAATHQNNAIHRLGADHLLGVHRHQIAELQAGRIEENFAERDGREFDRQRAGGKHAALHRFEHLRKMTVAVVEARARVGDADHGFGQGFARIAHRRCERAAEIKREVAVAVVG